MQFLVSGLAVAISLLALLISWRAHEANKKIRRQDMRMRTRQELDDVLARAGNLPESIAKLKEKALFMFARAGTINSGAAVKEEQERDDMQADADRLLSELQRLDTDLSTKNDTELELILSDANRLGRQVAGIHDKISAKITEFEANERRTTEIQRDFREAVKNQKPMGGLFGKE